MSISISWYKNRQLWLGSYMGASSLALRMNSCQSGATTRVWPCHPRLCRLAARARARSVRSIEEKPTRHLAIWVRSTCARSKVMLSLLCLAKGVRATRRVASVGNRSGGDGDHIHWWGGREHRLGCRWSRFDTSPSGVERAREREEMAHSGVEMKSLSSGWPDMPARRAMPGAAMMAGDCGGGICEGRRWAWQRTEEGGRGRGQARVWGWGRRG